MIDDRGRLFGRLNLFDAFVVLFLLGLIPVSIATFLLFRTPPARITSVTQVPITYEERRLAAGSYIAAKLKVRGSGLRPVLRATVDDTPTLGFVFESPGSADVIVGRVPPGVHDLVLYDGIQEVARAPKAVQITMVPTTMIRAIGMLLDLDRATAEALKEGESYPDADNPATMIVRLGPIEPARRRVPVAGGGAYVDFPVGDLFERRASVMLRCDPNSAEDDCAVAGTSLARITDVGGTATIPTRPFSVTWQPQPLRMVADTILPNVPAVPAAVRVRFTVPAEVLKMIATGDRDDFFDDRAATVAAVGADGTTTLQLGADDSREGLRYRGRLLLPGAPFTLTTPKYVVAGTVIGAAAGRKESD